MTDDTDDATIVPGDAVDVEVADDPEDARCIATGMTVSASEQVSTGDYESYEPFQSVKFQFRPAIDVTDPAGRVAVRKHAMKAHRDIQNDLARAIDARLSDPDFEDWPDSVPKTNLEEDR